MNLVKTREFKVLVYLSVVVLFMKYWNIPDTLDLKFFYTVSEAESFLKTLSEDQVEIYINHQYFDTLYIFGYVSLFYLLMVRAVEKTRYCYLVIVPGLLDFIETWTILGVLHESICVPEWLGYITAFKWISAYIVMGVLLFLYWVKLKPKVG